jgi:outer membrane usher protein
MVSVPATEPPASLSSPDRAASDLHEMLVQVRLKPQMIEETITTLQDGTGMFFIAADDLKRWRINVRRAAPMVWQGKNYYRTDDLPRLQGRFDEAEQMLSLELPAEELMPTHWMLQSQLAASPVKPSPGLFVNYDLLGEGGSLGTRASALLELGLFNSFGVGIQTGVMRHRPEDNQFIRLDTTFTSDSPADLASWRMGDAITRPANAWGRSVRFAGLQYATNFAVQPGFIAMPQQNITGQAALPSTAEVFVNNALV